MACLQLDSWQSDSIYDPVGVIHHWRVLCNGWMAIMFFVDSLGKAFGFALKDENTTYGFDKEKHKYSIVRNNKLSFIGMAISFVWSLSLAGFCYYYMVALW